MAVFAREYIRRARGPSLKRFVFSRVRRIWQVRQMRHVIAARVLQDTAPSRRHGRGKPSTPGSDSPWAWDVGGGEGELEDLDLLAGMDSNDTDYRKARQLAAAAAVVS